MSALDEATAEKRRGSRDPNLTKRLLRTDNQNSMDGAAVWAGLQDGDVVCFIQFRHGRKKMANVATSTFVDPPSSHHLGPTI